MDVLSGNVHLVAGGREMIERVLEALGHRVAAARSNPDIFIREYVQFGVEDARDVRARASTRAIGDSRAFIIVASAMTSEAQNALLKTLEEPASNAVFFIIVPSPETLLPTFRSRAQTLLLEWRGREEKVSAKQFLVALPSARMEMLRTLLPQEGEERNLGPIIHFLLSLERELSKIGATSARDGLEAVYRARKYVADKGSMLKHLLEQVALLVPRV